MKKKSISNGIPKIAFKNILYSIAYAVLQEKALFCMVNGMLPLAYHVFSEKTSSKFVNSEWIEGKQASCNNLQKGIYYSK